ncbi:glycosyltransferase family 4 protein [Deminuibacter soli]|uniref:Glycosyltransferase family 1 protein n=1 Tax=Deminuibacter soli TaxID=2291815 RepID=A0A3E1NRC1_9BACT|nr:glycosyltransferase family 1 protein [Deminuibacter soli]RFM30475.1 glycosyltransferase family 1 protein [Deminuibacter soli]
MRIVIKTNPSFTVPQTAAGIYVHELVSRWILQDSVSEFTCITDGDPVAGNGLCSRTLAVTPAIKGEISARFWYDVKLPGVLKKEKTGLFIGAESYGSLTAGTRQLLLVPHLAFLQQRKMFLPHEKIAWLGKMVRKATHVVVPSAFAKAQLEKHTQLPADKITVLHAAAGPHYEPVSWAQREQTKVTYAGACEYFLCYGTLYQYRNIGLLLKAFSVFKKWQKSNMKLVIVGDTPGKYAAELDMLDTYKYRSDVEMLDPQNTQTMAQLVAGAYAVVHPSSYEDIGMQALEAMASGVPVIAADAGAIPELCGDAALYAPAGDVEALGQQMIKVYKDESLREQAIEKGKQRATQYSWNNQAAQLAALAARLHG